MMAMMASSSCMMRSMIRISSYLWALRLSLFPITEVLLRAEGSEDGGGDGDNDLEDYFPVACVEFTHGVSFSFFGLVNVCCYSLSSG